MQNSPKQILIIAGHVNSLKLTILVLDHTAEGIFTCELAKTPEHCHGVMVENYNLTWRIVAQKDRHHHSFISITGYVKTLIDIP
jgi:hypothetical protein